MSHRNLIPAVWRVAMFLIVALAFALPAQEAAAQSNEQCFAETGYCVNGRMLQYWSQNGGLATFGLPLSA